MKAFPFKHRSPSSQAILVIPSFWRLPSTSTCPLNLPFYRNFSPFNAVRLLLCLSRTSLSNRRFACHSKPTNRTILFTLPHFLIPQKSTNRPPTSPPHTPHSRTPPFSRLAPPSAKKLPHKTAPPQHFPPKCFLIPYLAPPQNRPPFPKILVTH